MQPQRQQRITNRNRPMAGKSKAKLIKSLQTFKSPLEQSRSSTRIPLPRMEKPISKIEASSILTVRNYILHKIRAAKI
jgi:hypothetical protein